MTAKEKLVYWLASRLQTIKQKITLLEERRGLIEQRARLLIKLSHCFKDKKNTSLDTFWSAFQKEEEFEALLSLLSMDEKEIKAWRTSYQYQFSNPDGFISRVSNSTYYYFNGAGISLAILKQKAGDAVGAVYDFLLDESMTGIEKDKKFDELIRYHADEGLLQIQIKLEGFLNMLDIPLPSAFLDKKTPPSLSNVNQQVDDIDGRAVTEVRRLRYSLRALFQGLSQLQEDLEKGLENASLLFSGISQLKTWLADNSLLLSKNDIQAADKLCDKVISDGYQHMSEGLDAKAGTSFDQIKILHQERIAKIIEVKEEVSSVLKKLDEKGEHLRHVALRELTSFIIHRRGVWESVLRFVSPSYKRCMKRIEAILSSRRFSSVMKVEGILSTVEETKRGGFFYIRARLSKINGVNKLGFFTLKPSSPEGLDKMPRHSLKKS